MTQICSDALQIHLLVVCFPPFELLFHFTFNTSTIVTYLGNIIKMMFLFCCDNGICNVIFRLLLSCHTLPARSLPNSDCIFRLSLTSFRAFVLPYYCLLSSYIVGFIRSLLDLSKTNSIVFDTRQFEAIQLFSFCEHGSIRSSADNNKRPKFSVYFGIYLLLKISTPFSWAAIKKNERKIGTNHRLISRHVK